MKKILVTGSNSFLGQKIISKLDPNRFEFICHYNDKKKIFKKKKVSYIKTNFLKLNEIKNFNKKLAKFGKFDSFIHLSSPKINLKRFYEYPWGEYEKHINVQLRSVHIIIQSMIKKNMISDNFKFFILSSAATQRIPPKGMAPYILTKLILEKYFGILKNELTTKNISIFVLNPKAFESPLHKNIPKNFLIKDKKESLKQISQTIEFIKKKLN
jgi:short-subunit dehydrogenase